MRFVIKQPQRSITGKQPGLCYSLTLVLFGSLTDTQFSVQSTSEPVFLHQHYDIRFCDQLQLTNIQSFIGFLVLSLCRASALFDSLSDIPILSDRPQKCQCLKASATAAMRLRRASNWRSAMPTSRQWSRPFHMPARSTAARKLWVPGRSLRSLRKPRKMERFSKR